jgi:nucleoside-diphosphate-sugar epimerase
MRLFVAGATGAIGKQLVPRLVTAGHEVTGMTRSEAKQAMLYQLGAVPVVADALDPDQVADAVAHARPDVIVHELTAIGAVDLRHFERSFAQTSRLRTEGTNYLLSAGQAVGVRRFVAQSNGAFAYARTGGAVKGEDDPLDPSPPREMRGTAAAIRHLEEAVLGAEWTEGIVLRYGAFYGPGTSLAPGEEQFELIRKASSRWSATVPGCGRSSTSPTRRRRRWRRSSRAAAVSTTWSTMTPPPSRSGCRRWLRPWARRSRCASRGSSGGCSPGRSAP